MRLTNGRQPTYRNSCSARFATTRWATELTGKRVSCTFNGVECQYLHDIPIVPIGVLTLAGLGLISCEFMFDSASDDLTFTSRLPQLSPSAYPEVPAVDPGTLKSLLFEEGMAKAHPGDPAAGYREFSECAAFFPNEARCQRALGKAAYHRAIERYDTDLLKEATSALQTYLRLAPKAEDKDQILGMLRQIRSGAFESYESRMALLLERQWPVSDVALIISHTLFTVLSWGGPCLVIVGGEDLGMTPLVDVPVRAGNHIIEFLCEEHAHIAEHDFVAGARFRYRIGFE